MNPLAECRPQVEHLVARILRRKKDDPDVQDCTNETLRRALEHDKRSLPGDVLIPWVLGIARHVALDALRAEYRRRARNGNPKPTPGDSAHDEFLARLPAGTLDPETLAANRQNMARLEAALDTLPTQQRNALLALHVEGLGYREVALRMGVPVATIGTWVLRARQALLDALPRIDVTRATTEERNGNQ